MGKSVRLEAKGAGDGRKFYTVEIVGACDDGYSVNYTYGAVGGNTKTGTKTPKPVELTEAEKVFDALVKEKMTGSSHYRPVPERGTNLIVSPVAFTDEAVRGIIDDLVVPALVKKFIDENTARKCFPPRLLNDVDPDQALALIEDDDWWVQIKHDGDRVQLQAEKGVVTLFSARSGLVRECPKALAAMFRASDCLTVLDGELVGDVFWAFDLMFVDGEDFRYRRYEERYGILEPWSGMAWPGNGPLRLVSAAKTHDEKAALILKAIADNEEGVCFINKNAPYKEGRPSRGGDNLRWKFKASASVIVGKRHATKRSVEALLYGGERIGTVPVPVNREFPPEGSVIEVAYLYMMRSLIQAVYKGTRPDIRPEDCTRGQLRFKKRYLP